MSAGLRPFTKIKKEKLVQDNDFHKAITELATEIAKSTNTVSGTNFGAILQSCYFTDSLEVPLLKVSFHSRTFTIL